MRYFVLLPHSDNIDRPEKKPVAELAAVGETSEKDKKLVPEVSCSFVYTSSRYTGGPSSVTIVAEDKRPRLTSAQLVAHAGSAKSSNWKDAVPTFMLLPAGRPPSPFVLTGKGDRSAVLAPSTAGPDTPNTSLLPSSLMMNSSIMSPPLQTVHEKGLRVDYFGEHDMRLPQNPGKAVAKSAVSLPTMVATDLEEAEMEAARAHRIRSVLIHPWVNFLPSTDDP